MNARDMLYELRMSARPGYFSGRGATTSDLNYEILTAIAKMIEKHHGKAAKKNFVNMVAGMEKCTATDFLLELFTLENNGWKYKEQKFNKNGIYPEDIGTAIGTVIEGFAGNTSRDQTPLIRNQFLRENGKKVKSEFMYSPDGTYYSRSPFGDDFYFESDDMPDRLKKLYEDDK